MNVLVDWKKMTSRNKSLCRVLYAYVHPQANEILYIGKADLCSVYERFQGVHKESLYDFFEETIGIRSFKTIIGLIALETGKRLSQGLLSDVESLLIKRLVPCGNIQSKKSRISRPGLRVYCQGAWPLDKRVFHDTG